MTENHEGQMKEDQSQESGETKATNNEDMTFWDKFVEFLTGQNREERQKNRKLKEISKKLGHLKFKFYNDKKDVLLPQLGTFFYDIYRKDQSLAKYFDVKGHSKSIKQLLFESFNTPAQNKIRDDLQRDKIIAGVKGSKDIKKVIADIKLKLTSYIKSFDVKVVSTINTTYNQVVNLSYLLTYDWYYVVHKFDSAIREDNFDYHPNCDSLDGKYLLDDLIAINDYLHSVDLNADLKNVINYLKIYGEDKSIAELLKTIIHSFRILKRDDYLTKIIRLISQDPYFKPKSFLSKEKIVQDFLLAYQGEVKQYVNESLALKKKEQTDNLLMLVFKSTIILRLKNYTQKLNDFLRSKGVIGSLKYIDPMNYTKAFLLDICKGELKPRFDLLIIKGEWVSHSKSAEFSTSLENVNRMTERILEFDKDCGADGRLGKEIKRLAGTIKHDPKAKGSVKKVIVGIDTEAYTILTDSIKIYADLAEKIKILVDDHNLKISKMIINFHSISWDFSPDFIKDMMLEYRKISDMVKLLKIYLKNN